MKNESVVNLRLLFNVKCARGDIFDLSALMTKKDTPPYFLVQVYFLGFTSSKAIRLLEVLIEI